MAASVLAIATLCTVLALRAFLAGLARLGPAASAVVNAFEIPITMTLAVMFLGERVGLRQGLGAALIAGAILLRTGRLLRFAAGRRASRTTRRVEAAHRRARLRGGGRAGERPGRVLADEWL